MVVIAHVYSYLVFHLCSPSSQPDLFHSPQSISIIHQRGINM